jgi:hypothetical protein
MQIAQIVPGKPYRATPHSQIVDIGHVKVVREFSRNTLWTWMGWEQTRRGAADADAIYGADACSCCRNVGQLWEAVVVVFF